MPTSTPAELHVQADALWRSIHPDDPAADHFSDIVRLLLKGRSGTPRRVTKWVNVLHRYEEHWHQTGRHPRENTRARDTLPDAERRLGEWARYQRRFEHQLNGYQRARLDVSPAFEWDPLDTRWQARLTECENFVRRTGELPRLRAEHRDEFVLARWLGRQLHRLQTGRLEQKHAAELQRLLWISRRC